MSWIASREDHVDSETEPHTTFKPLGVFTSVGAAYLMCLPQTVDWYQEHISSELMETQKEEATATLKEYEEMVFNGEYDEPMKFHEFLGKLDGLVDRILGEAQFTHKAAGPRLLVQEAKPVVSEEEARTEFESRKRTRVE